MSKKFLTPIVPPVLDSDPSGGSEGAIYFNSSSNALKFYNGTSWVELSQAGGATAASSIRTLSSAPSSPAEGDVYFDTVENVIKSYNGTSWSDVGGPKALLDHVHNYDGSVGYVNYGTFVDSGIVSYDAGNAYSTTFNDILDGGNA
jgi:hypothetical protein